MLEERDAQIAKAMVKGSQITTTVIDDTELQRGLPVAAPGRHLIARIMAELITCGQVRITCSDHDIDFIGHPMDSDAVAVRVLVPTHNRQQVARWLGVHPELIDE